jgi:hypothetical protein
MLHRFTLLLSVILLSSPSEAEESRPSSKKDSIVYQEALRYGGWPANQGIWAWGDEVVVGFTAGWYKAVASGHAIDSSKPYEKWQARSLDGGATWSVEKPPQFANAGVMPNQTKLSQPLDFTAPAFALMFQTYNYNTGPSWFHVSTDRGRTWSAPFEFAVEGIEKIAARTDYLVLGPQDCLMFGSAAKSNGKEGRAFCARTIDGGITWKLASKIGVEPGGYAIMPSSLRLKSGAILTTIRRTEPKQDAFIEARLSDDLGAHWQNIGVPAPKIGSGNPPSLIALPDGRLCLCYGYRAKPYGIRARLSSDKGRTWGDEIILRDDALTSDLGYCRSIARTDGQILTVYYYNGPKPEDRTIQATRWKP